jgi:glycosyltransferase involved in cell wall biosynthesis
MKILYITLENLSLHKGSVVHIKEIVAGLQKLGHHVGLVGSSQNKFEEVDNFYNLRQSPFFLLKFFKLKKQPYLISSIFLLFYLFKILPQYDIIYARDYHTAVIAFLPRILFNKKLVFEMNGFASEEEGLKGNSFFKNILVWAIKKMEKLATRCSNEIVTVTPYMATYLVQSYDCEPQKIEVIGNGVNIRKFYPINDDALLLECRKRIKIAPEEIIITFVGNLNKTQGVEDIIKVAPSIIREMNNIKFLIIGDGLLKGDLEEEVKRLRLSEHFIFTGMIDYQEVPIYINISDICILLKRKLKSGWSPIKLYEYMACGKPVVCSRVEGLEFIGLEGAGRVVEPGDLDDLKEALFDLLRFPENRVDMGHRGLKIAQERFTWDSRASNIEKILKELA